MILVADSGSSKTDWISSHSRSSNKKLEFTTSGMNPFFVNEKEIIKILQNTPDVPAITKEVEEVYFFGAGCSNPDRREVISNALSQVFRNAFINVESDIVGSAYATCGNGKGLTCILGTGSNITYYTGKEVINGKHGLGYILGDEGSGTWFGKRLITSYLYNTMPDELHKEFNKSFELTKELVIQNVYQKPFPNFYLASFAKFMSPNKEHPFIVDLLYSGFIEFIQTNIQSYPDYKDYNCHFVGSIAYHFQDILHEACDKYDVTVGKILKRPIDDLFRYIMAREVV